jgi:hypothetical protein
MPGVWRAIHAKAGRWRTAALLLEAVPGADAHPAAEAQGGRQRPGFGGAGRPFPDAELILEEIAERIAAEAAALPRICPWCVATLANGGEAFCGDYCREEYLRKIMPPKGREQVAPSRPAPPATRRAMIIAPRASEARRRAQQAAP